MSDLILTTTPHTIGKVTYYIVSESSEKARESLDKKIEKLIRKDLGRQPKNPYFANKNE